MKVIDVLSRRSTMFAVNNKNSTNSKRCLKVTIKDIGTREATDNGSVFNNEAFDL